MAPGEDVNDMVSMAAQSSAESLRQLDSQVRGRRVDLWKWVTHENTISRTYAVYGKHSPYKDPAIEVALWLTANVPSTNAH